MRVQPVSSRQRHQAAMEANARTNKNARPIQGKQTVFPNQIPDKSPGKGQLEPMNVVDLSWMLGAKVKVSTVIDDVCEASIYAYCPYTNTLTLQDSSSSEFRILKINFLKDIEVLEPPPSSSQDIQTAYENAVPPLGPVTLPSSRGSPLAQPARGVDVTAEAQSIFDAFSKTLPCRWAGKSIIVLDAIRVDEPYTSDACRAPANQAHALAQVRKVLDGERKRLKLPINLPRGEERKGG
jgi:hypothetical protein